MLIITSATRGFIGNQKGERNRFSETGILVCRSSLQDRDLDEWL